MAGGAAVDFYTENDALDLWIATRRSHPWRKQLVVLQDRHDFPILNQWLGQYRQMVGGGTEVEWQVQIDDNGTAEFIAPNQPLTYAVPQTLKRVRVPWRQLRDYYVSNEDEISENRDDEYKLIDLLDAKRTGMAHSFGNRLESRGFEAPADSSDTLNPYGVPYWVTPITSAQVAASTDGHQGANPLYEDGNAISSCGGIDASLSANALWRNYNDVWTNTSSNFTEDDIDKLVKMSYETKFRSPMNAKEFESGALDNYRYYTGIENVVGMDRKARANNDSLGADLGKFAGQVVVRGNPVVRHDDLDASEESTRPLYALDHRSFGLVVQTGWVMKEVGPQTDRDQPLTYVTNVFLKFNFYCKNRRKQGVISYVT